MNNLYIIGNGFDLFHGLDTSYESFANYLSCVNRDLYDLIIKYYRLPDISILKSMDNNYAKWSSFELAIANLRYEEVLEDFAGSAADLSSEDFSDRDWHTYQIDMEIIIQKLTSNLISIFNDFISYTSYPNKNDISILNIKSESLFLNFNYTDTLEKYYSDYNNLICYIHGKSSKKSVKLILGHGTEPSQFKSESPKPPYNLCEFELQKWREFMSDSYDFSYQSAKNEILSYYFKTFKNSKLIIEKNIKFFNKMSLVESVYVLGHSISTVDINYFEAVVKHVKQDAIWYVTYYSDLEKQEHFKTLKALSIREKYIFQIKMNELK